MAKKRIFILGAGLAGLSAAWHLQKKGIACEIFEKQPEIGGLCRSKNIRGFIFDYDGHLLHFRHRYTFNLVRRLLKGNLLEHKRSAWVYSHRCFIRFPFQANLYGLPPSVREECLLGFIEASKDGRHRKNLNFFRWIKHTFGAGIAKHFMVPYNTKFWTVPVHRLTCDWLDGFIPLPKLSEVIQGARADRQREFGYNVHFFYPRRGGIASLPLSLASEVRNIHTTCHIQEIDLKQKELRMLSGRREKFNYLVSTIPLPDLPAIIKGIPRRLIPFFKMLRWNSILNVNLGVEKGNTPFRHWVYFPGKNEVFFRLGYFSNFSPDLIPDEGKSSLYIEVSYAPDKKIDREKILLRIKGDLKRIGVLTERTRIYAEDVNDIKYGYPIYDKYYQKARSKIVTFLRQNNILPCGRYGSWSYFSMEDAILDGKRVAEGFNG